MDDEDDRPKGKGGGMKLVIIAVYELEPSLFYGIPRQCHVLGVLDQKAPNQDIKP
jgi:hypothetical protein